MGGLSDYGDLLGHICLIRRLIVRRRSDVIIFTFQPALASVSGFHSVGVPLQFVFVSW